MPDPKNEKVTTKEKIKNFSMQELAEKLYVEFGKLQAHFKKQVHPLDSDAAINRSTELADGAEQVMFGFNDYQFEDLKESDAFAKDPAANFKKAVKAAVDYLDDTEPSGYSLRNYAEREKITSPEFRYLMNRCMDITGVAPKGLNDDEIAGYDMDEMAERVRLVHDAIFYTLRRNGEELPEEAMNVVGSLNGYSVEKQQKEKEQSFKDAMGSWDAFFNAKLSNGQTVAEYAEENDLLSYGYEKLVRRAKEIAGIEVAEPEVEQKQAEVAEPEVEQKQAEVAEPEVEQKQAEVAQEPMTMKDYLLGKAKESIKAALDLIPDSPDWGDEKEKEEVFRHLSTARAAAYFAQRQENAARTIEDLDPERHFKEIAMWANMQMRGQLFQGAFGSETPQGIKNVLTDPEKEGTPVSPAELLERYNERIKDIVITVDADQAPWLNNEQEEQKPEQEQAPEQEAEPTLSDEAVSKLGVEDVARKLYNEFGKLGGKLDEAYGGKWLNETEDTQYAFDDVLTREDPKLLKGAIKKAEDFLNSDLGDGKTVGNFGRDNKLLGGNFEKLMDRAREIAGMERQAEQPADLDESVVVRAPVQKTAAKWIEGYKERLATKVKGKDKGDNYPAADIALIFAARELSDSVRGKASTLNKPLTNGDIQARADAIMKNASFQDFAAKLSKGENLSKVEAIFTKKHSHGGELDDLFRDYLTKRPAGQLENDPGLKRWMPTVKQRVEFLQKEAAKTQKENKTPYKEAAEILLLRQAAGVQRGGKGLETKVPVAGEKASSLSDSVKGYAENDDFKKAFDQPDVKKYILAGHGGEMVERLKKQQPEAEKGKQNNGQEKGM